MTSFHFFSEPFTHALGWALVHTLWQGTVFAAAAAWILRMTQVRSSSVRYGVGIGAMALQLLTFLGTLWICYEPVRATLLISGDQQTSLVMTSPVASNWTGELVSWLNPHFPMLVTAWFCGATLLVLRLVGGWVFVQRLTRKNIRPVPEVWQNYLNQLSTQLGMTKAVRLIESTQIAVPMTIGWLKPVVLLPIGLLAGLSPRQLEAVLAHELAHIRRYDYLVNLIQSAVEIILFFHPAIWWLSARVRQEREHCCDDVAIQWCGERVSLAQALVYIEEQRQAVLATPVLAMAFGARKQSFVQRVKRVIGVSEQPSASKPNALLVAGCLVLLTGLVTGQHLYHPVKNNQRHADSITINTWKSEGDTVIELAEPKEISLTLLDKLEPQVEFSKADTIDPFTRIRLEKELEYHAEEMTRLEREMGKINPQIKTEQLLQLKNKVMELAALEQDKATEKMNQLQIILERDAQRAAELEQKRANGKLNQEEIRRLEQAQQDMSQWQKKLEQLNGDAFAKMHVKIQVLNEGSMQRLNDSLGEFTAKAAKLADIATFHAVETMKLQEKLSNLDTLRTRVADIPAVPAVPAFEAAPVPAIAPIPNAAPRPARVPKAPRAPAAAMPSPAPVPPVIAIVPPTPEPVVAPESDMPVRTSDWKNKDKKKLKGKTKSKTPKPANVITAPKAEN